MERFNSELFLTTSEVAELLGVHASSVKRWCNEGGLEIEKTEGGHRRIHLQDAVELARSRSIPTFLSPFTPYEAHVWTAVRQVLDEGSFDRIHSLALGWLQRGHLRRIGRLFVELGRHAEISLPLFCDEGVRGFMELVGEAWRSGRLRVGEEHMVSEALIESLLRLRDEGGEDQTRDPSRDGERNSAIVGAMEGDRHHLGALCVRLLLERSGWRVFYLGADVPIEDFAALQRARGAELVCVSFAPPNTAADMRRCIRVLSEFYDPGRPYGLALGGRIGDPPVLDDLTPPFPDLAVFDSVAGFGDALADGFAGHRGIVAGTDGGEGP